VINPLTPLKPDPSERGAPEDLLHLFWIMPEVKADTSFPTDYLRRIARRLVPHNTFDDWIPVQSHPFPRSVRSEFNERLGVR